MKKSLTIIGLALLIGLILWKINTLNRDIVDQSQSVKLNYEEMLAKAGNHLTPLLKLSTENKKIPRSVNEEGNIRWINENYDWTEGFWPGTCWMLYNYTNDQKWEEGAIESQQLFVEHRNLTNDHDLGFIFINSFGKAYKITGKEEYKQVIIDAASSLITRFNPTIGCIQSWNCGNNWQGKRGWKFPVIVDNLMNLELLFTVSEITGDDQYKNVAITHANTTMKNHFRENGSSYHVLDYDPQTGNVKSKETAQGYADESAWARGQAWGLYGYTMCYRFTHDKKYLDFAEKIATFILNHPNYPADGVPYWDYDAPNIPNEPKDASAAAIMASAFIELSSYTNGKYIDHSRHILKSLSSQNYMAADDTNGNFLLMHNVGSLPHGKEIDVPLNYADFYYIEALLRMKNWKQ